MCVYVCALMNTLRVRDQVQENEKKTGSFTSNAFYEMLYTDDCINNVYDIPYLVTVTLTGVGYEIHRQFV